MGVCLKTCLFDIARNQATDTMGVIHQLIDSVGWSLVAEEIKLPRPEEKREIGQQSG